MNPLNYNFVVKLSAIGRRPQVPTRFAVHKRPTQRVGPKVSIILLDWSCRESLHALEWLNRQDVPRCDYELIWIDLYDRVPQEALAQADVVVTLNQKGLYHKHVGYNVGLLLARGDVITICDSDAVFPQDFVRSILTSFYEPGTNNRRSLVLMHDELRTAQTYPESLADAEELKDQERWQWWDVTPNAGACMSVLRDDALRFGGFDECSSYRGYLCGPYDLGWRLVNAGMPEIWHDHSTVIWHFAHPDPVGVNGFSPSVRRLFENSYPHVDLHALTAVEHFSTGRLLPIRENPGDPLAPHGAAKIGTRFEERYSNITGPRGFRRWQSTLLRMMLLSDLLGSATRLQARVALTKLIGKPAVDRIYGWLFARNSPESRRRGQGRDAQYRPLPGGLLRRPPIGRTGRLQRPSSIGATSQVCFPIANSVDAAHLANGDRAGDPATTPFPGAAQDDFTRTAGAARLACRSPKVSRLSQSSSLLISPVGTVPSQRTSL